MEDLQILELYFRRNETAISETEVKNTAHSATKLHEIYCRQTRTRRNV